MVRQDWLVCAVCGLLVGIVSRLFDVDLLPVVLICVMVFFAGIHTAVYNGVRKV